MCVLAVVCDVHVVLLGHRCARRRDTSTTTRVMRSATEMVSFPPYDMIDDVPCMLAMESVLTEHVDAAGFNFEWGLCPPQTDLCPFCVGQYLPVCGQGQSFYNPCYSHCRGVSGTWCTAHSIRWEKSWLTV